MALDTAALYRVHVSNLRTVRTAMEHVDRELRSTIARQQHVSSDALLKLLLLLTGSWAECRLKKLMYEPNGFSALELQDIKAKRSQTDRWLKAVEIGFRKRYGVTATNIAASLPVTPRFRYTTIVDAIQNDLAPMIEMRNTLAHGQWHRPLNNEETDVNSDMCRQLATENCLSAGFKLKIIEGLSSIIHDLVAGNHAFERDFDSHFSNLENARRNLANRSFEQWRTAMIEKYRRGIEMRAQNLRNEGANGVLGTIRAALGI